MRKVLVQIIIIFSFYLFLYLWSFLQEKQRTELLIRSFINLQLCYSFYATFALVTLDGTD